MNKAILTTVFFFSLTLSFSQIISKTIDGSTGSGGQDTYTSSGSPSTHYSSSSIISTYVDGSNASPNYRRTFLEFDLSTEVPENAIIISAEIVLVKTSGSNSTSTELNVISESWDDFNVDHNNQPNVHNSSPNMVTQTPTVVNNSLFGNNWTTHSFDVTDQVQFLANYDHLNFGWRIKSADETVSCFWNGMMFICSTRGASYISIDGDGGNPWDSGPELHVEYVLPIEITLNSITHADTPTSSNGSISVNVDKGDGTYSYQWIDGSSGIDISGEMSPTISGLEPGWYGVEVTDEENNVSYMAFVVGAKCGVVQIDFQPDSRFVDQTTVGTGTDGNNMPYDDRNLSTTIVYRSERRLNTTHDFYFESLFRNRLIIPNNIELVSASQYYDGIYHVYNNGNESLIKNINEEWQEEVSTWNIRPTYSSNILTIPTTTSSSQDVNLDLTDLYKDFQDGTSTNYGQSIVLNYPSSTTNRKMQFYNANYSTVSSRPKLTLEIGKLCFSGYTKLKRQLDASYTFTQFGVLKFSFEQPYQMHGNDLDIKLFQEDRTEISLSGLPSINYDDNRVQLDLSNLSLTVDDFYYIEVTLPKGGKRYLRFQYKN